MKIQLKQVEGNTYVGKGESNHWVTVDASPNSGGADAGTRPMELLLIALAGCTAMDVESILKKKRAGMTNLEVEVSGEKQDEYPKRFRDIHITYIIHGDVKQSDAEQAVQLSREKYCSVSGSLNANVTSEIRIVE
ncbi:MAG: OsmC family protein [Bacteroidetes bacterium]|nr:OsmC family protein [Bacteroidota bacterium]